MTLQFNEHGLIPALAQDRFDGQVRMLAWMNREALEHTLETGLARFSAVPAVSCGSKGKAAGTCCGCIR